MDFVRHNFLARAGSIGLAHDLGEACEGKGRSTGRVGHYGERDFLVIKKKGGDV
jgi:hypothetical protein